MMIFDGLIICHVSHHRSFPMHRTSLYQGAWALYLGEPRSSCGGLWIVSGTQERPQQPALPVWTGVGLAPLPHIQLYHHYPPWEDGGRMKDLEVVVICFHQAPEEEKDYVEVSALARHATGRIHTGITPFGTPTKG